MNTEGKHIWLAAEGGKGITQARRVAYELQGMGNAFPVASVQEEGALGLSNEGSLPDILIGVGAGIERLVAEIKTRHRDCLAVMLLDPGKDYDIFDMVVVPSYEPSPDFPKKVTTTGLINGITPTQLQAIRIGIENGEYPDILLTELPAPHYAVLVGGRYASGNITAEDAAYLGSMLNGMIESAGGGSLLIATSPRTEEATADALKATLSVPHTYYDYRRDRHMRNPYEAYLALADGIVVTGDSVRMCSESCSSGKPVRIFQPDIAFTPYAALHQELYEGGFAQPFTGEFPLDGTPAHFLNEAHRIAKLIAEKSQMVPMP